MSDSVAGQLVTLTVAAEVLGRSRQWLGTLVRDGRIPRQGESGYRLGDVVRAALAAVAQDRRQTAESVERSKLLAARRKLLEQRAAERVGKSFGREETRALMFEFLGAHKAEADGWPAQIAGRDHDLRERAQGLVDDTFRRSIERIDKLLHERYPGDAA
jgi:hypothetical protein